MKHRKSHSPFRQLLAQRRRVWQRSGQWAALMRGLAIFLAGLVVLAALDALLALAPAARISLMLAWALLCTGFALTHIIQWQRRGDKAFARHADQIAGYRNPILSALESEEAAQSETRGTLGQFLSARLVKEGRMALLLHPEDSCRRSPIYRRARTVSLSIAAVVALILVIAWPISEIVLPRLFAPWQDRPPYSPYTFAVQLPDAPVYYGDSARLSVNITGAPLKDPVVLRIREPDGTQERVAFQESPTRFMQEIENLTRDVEFSFATGRARTHWMRVPIRYEPRILVARLRETPPPYTGIPERDLLLRDPRISGYPGTWLELSLASNRPLSAGQLHLQSPDSGKNTTLTAEIRDSNLAVFRWPLEKDAEIEVFLEDIRGTHSREPFLLSQILREDTSPEVTITLPPAYSLATPSTLLQLEGYARDDLGLSQVNLWRGLGQFRDRPLSLGPQTRSRSLDIHETFPLSQLGVTPGDVLAFHLQARDTRPHGGGTTSSNQVHIEIIDEETYAEILRQQLTIQDFARKMTETSDALQAVANAAEALREAMESGADPETTQALHQALSDSLHQAAELMEKLTADFPIYDIEQQARDTWAEAADSISKQIDLLDLLHHDPEAPAVLAGIREYWRGPDAEALNQLIGESELLADINAFMQHAANIGEIINAQQELVRDMDREANQPGGASPDELSQLARRQDAIQRQLDTTTEAIRQQAEQSQNHPELAEMCSSALEMIDLIGQLAISQDMVQSASAGHTYQPQPMLRHAATALEKLEQLMQDCSGSEFGGMCEGSQNFSIPRLDRTLSQMMDSLFSPGSGFGRGGRLGVGGGRGAGMGAIGGWGQSLSSPMGVPVYGPQRSGYSPHQTGHRPDAPGGNEGAGGSGAGRYGRGSPVESGGSIDAQPTQQSPREAILEYTVPERYRDAARRYFDLIEDSPTTQHGQP